VVLRVQNILIPQIICRGVGPEEPVFIFLELHDPSSELVDGLHKHRFHFLDLASTDNIPGLALQKGDLLLEMSHSPISLLKFLF
jgi:hypothetical protein